MSHRRPANTASVLATEARREVRRRDLALRAHVGSTPTEQDIIEALDEFFPGSNMNERQIRQYARSVVAGRPHFA